jgi:hypothetical protein
MGERTLSVVPRYGVIEDFSLSRSLPTAFTPTASESDDVKMALNKINARRVIQPEFAMNNFESEPLNGYVVRLERGRLGLTRVSHGG